MQLTWESSFEWAIYTHLLAFPQCVPQFIACIDVCRLLLVQSGTLCRCFVRESIGSRQSGVRCGCWTRRGKVGARRMVGYGYVVGTTQQRGDVTMMTLRGADIFEFRSGDSGGKNITAHCSGWACTEHRVADAADLRFSSARLHLQSRRASRNQSVVGTNMCAHAS